MREAGQGRGRSKARAKFQMKSGFSLSLQGSLKHKQQAEHWLHAPNLHPSLDSHWLWTDLWWEGGEWGKA